MEISLATPLMSRDGFLNKDPLMANCYWETNPQGGRNVVRRPALGPAAGALPAGPVQGVVQQGLSTFAVISDTLVQVPPADGSATIALPGVVNTGLRMSTVSTFNSGQNFTSFFKSTDSAWGWVGAGNVTQVTDANYPNMTVPGVAYLDGTYYVMDTGGQIHGSNIEDFTTWNALNFLSTDRGLGKSVALHRHLNYVVAFCADGTQFFYDAANPAPGSPLSPVPNVTSKIGCAHPFSIQSMDDVTIFLAKDGKRGRSFCMIEGMSFRKISTPDIERVLERNQFDTYDVFPVRHAGGGSTIGHSGYANLYTQMVKADGHTFYIFTMLDKGITLVYDVGNQHWSQWSTCTDGATHQSFQVATFFTAATTGPDAALYALPPNGGTCYPFGTGDVAGGETILMSIRTRPLDAGTTARKTLSEISLLGDTVAASINVSYSNDSGQTWSAARAIDLSTTRKRMHRLGTFVSRIFQFNCFTSVKVRLESLIFPDRDLPSRAQPTAE